MLKHVSTTNLRRKASLDTVGSTGSTSSGSTQGSRTSLHTLGLHSETSSNTSHTSDTSEPEYGLVKVYARVVCSDIEYKMFRISSNMTCRNLIELVLKKCKVKNKDPNLFFVTMEVAVRKRGIPFKSMLILEDDAHPLVLQSCQGSGGSKFFLNMKRGGLIKIHVGNLIRGLYYKSLLISQTTTCREVVRLLLQCYKLEEDTDKFSLREVCRNPDNFYEKKLLADDCPLLIQECWNDAKQYAFVLRREPMVRKRRKRNRAQSLVVTDDSLTGSDNYVVNLLVGCMDNELNLHEMNTGTQRNTCYFV